MLVILLARAGDCLQLKSLRISFPYWKQYRLFVFVNAALHAYIFWIGSEKRITYLQDPH